jgi:hypothetical protein
MISKPDFRASTSTPVALGSEMWIAISHHQNGITMMALEKNSVSLFLSSNLN